MRPLPRRAKARIVRYLLLTTAAVVMVYPLLWLVGATFRPNTELFASAGILPLHPDLDGWRKAFSDYGGQINLMRAMRNTYLIALPKVLLTLVSVTLTAYGFARFRYQRYFCRRLCCMFRSSCCFTCSAGLIPLRICR